MLSDRQKIYRVLEKDGRLRNGRTRIYADENEFFQKYFISENSVLNLYNFLKSHKHISGNRKGQVYVDYDEITFFKKYVCGDLSWAKTTQYCGGSGGGSQSSGSQSSGSQSSGSQSSGSQPVSGGRQSTQIPSELKDIDGVKKFQDWLDVNHSGWHRKYGTLNKNLLRGYGKYGPNTTRGWDKYKNEYLNTPNSTATPSSESPSNWMDLFPSCVKGLKSFYSPPQNYFLGFGTDTKGVQYMIAYFSQELNQGRWCNIYKPDGTLVGNGFYSCTTNNQQITIKTLIGLSITGSVINPDSKDITSPKNNDEILEPSDDDVLMDYNTMVSKKTGV